jgi:hypothetical protein
MKFLLNELSIHDQFANSYAFATSLKHILSIRQIIKDAGSRLYCTNRLLMRPVHDTHQVNNILMQPNFHTMRSLVLRWLSTEGPFWDTPPGHDFEEDYFTLAADEDVLVTKSALAEAAFLIAREYDCSTVSFSPSDFCFSPLSVSWHQETITQVFDIQNFWEAQSVRALLEEIPVAITSWDEMLNVAHQRFQYLSFMDYLPEHLVGIPFRQAAAKRTLELLAVLNDLKQCFDSEGKRTPQGHEIIQNYFQGDSARFSDESERNKHRFEQEMTFELPDGRTVFCPFHGKIRTGVIRMHFTWPITANSPLYIVYIGPKLTKS